MSQLPDHEARITRLELWMAEVAKDAALARSDASSARHLAAANDRDHADLALKVDANRQAINALGEQTRERFDRMDGRFDTLEGRFDTLEGRFGTLERRVDGLEAEMRTGFAAMRHGFDQSAAGFARIAELITARDDDR